MKILQYITKSVSKEKFFEKSVKAILDPNVSNLNEIGKGKIDIQGITAGSKNAYVYSLFDKLREKGKSPKILYINGTLRETEEAYLDIKTLSYSDPDVCYFPDWGTMAYEHVSPFQDIIHQRIMVLHKLITGDPALVVLPVKALMRHIVPKDIFSSEYINLRQDEDFDLEELARKLVWLGYERVDKVIEAGTFAIKGGILDVFPSAFENPARVEFWGDTVDSIRLFDPISQKSIELGLKEIEVLPQQEIILNDEQVLRAVELIEDRFDNNYRDYHQIKKQLMEKRHFQGLEQYQPFIYPKANLINYLDSDSIYIFNEKTNLEKFSEKTMLETESFYHLSYKARDVRARPDEIFTEFKNLEQDIPKYINLSELIHLDAQYETDDDYLTTDGRCVITPIELGSVDNFMGDFEFFKSFVAENKDKAIILMSSYEGQAMRLQTALYDINPLLIEEDGELVEKDPSFKPEFGKVYITLGGYSYGFKSSSFVLIPDRDIRGKKKTYSKKIRRVNSVPIENFLDLRKGDFVVHINYGIGKFDGIERMEVMNKEREFIKILFANEENLYVPIEQLNLVQKYVGAGAKKVRLDRIGGKSWERRKAKAKKSIQEMADELLKIYAAREKLKGFSYSKDTQYQHQFEAEFEYEETPDQITAIEQVKQDMESVKPMDRLICGDVGYGKTEVAIRSAFKATMDGKQVAVLVPTTILSEQHYLTFSERFKDYPIVVEMLSRFRTKSEQKRVIKLLKEGKVDIIVGTHRLLSKDIKFKNLGLLIIDEEQRFGVKHKERLKKLRTLVDVISMSATPIPRTLHMSLTSIRDMSVINTPPENRLPIETYTLEFNEDIIRDAILKEIQRGGQAYFVYNRVKTIKSFAQFLMKIVPEAKVCVGHGQMEEEELEHVLMDFINRKYDVLICTTIIENGIDIPNVNTILIDRADRFGLSQLYQIRGRVGRENRQAYCYLFYSPDTALTEEAQKRLSIINEFTDLGSGFKIAMRDMEMRGAGNILGEEQSGDIIAIGYELYCKLLDDTIKKITIGEEHIDFDVLIDLNYDGYIPDDYIPDEKQKMEVYKRIAGCVYQEDVDALHEEIKDRFGDPPSIVKELMKISELKAVANRLRIPRIIEKVSIDDQPSSLNRNWVEVEFKEYSRIDPIKILPMMKASGGVIFINPHTPDKLYLKICDYSLEKKVNYIKETLINLSVENKTDTDNRLTKK